MKTANRSLQEDEAKNKKMFQEKMMQHGEGFVCRLCGFSSGVKVAAKTHSITCGNARKVGSRRPNVINCTECDETFGNKTDLNVHYKEKHLSRSNLYSCSQCGKKFCSIGVVLWST